MKSSYPATFAVSDGLVQQHLLLALGLIILEGGIRKWLIGTEGSPLGYLVYFSKDIAFAALLLYSRRRPGSAVAATFVQWALPGWVVLSAGAMLSSFSGFNPVGAGLTLRAGIVLPAIACLAIGHLPPAGIRSAVVLLSVLAGLNFALGALQNGLPPEHVLNRYVTGADHIVALDSGVRATGTFSYISGLAVMSTVGVWAGMAGLALAGSGWAAGLSALTAVAGFGCGLASISRGPVVVGSLMLGVWLVSRSGGRGLLGKLKLSWVTMSVALCMVVCVSGTFRQLWSGLLQRQDAVEDSILRRAFAPVAESLQALATAPFGQGLGLEQVGANYAQDRVLSFTTYESQFPRLILETGFLGLIGFLLVAGGALAALQTAKRNCESASGQALLTATQLFLFSVFVSNVVFNHTASAFAWMIFSVVASATGPEKT